ncbi:MAG: hypothetical protein EA409_10820 [Saprospirales bacterium]|nr:MAG: hypothetical protein EA409_10820 [Saprospirales bacterium]
MESKIDSFMISHITRFPISTQGKIFTLKNVPCSNVSNLSKDLKAQPLNSSRQFYLKFLPYPR